MSSKKSSSDSSSSNQSSNNSYQPPSNNSYYKSLGGYPTWMASHGLKHYNLDDVEEGKAILEGYKESDRLSWEEAQGKK